MARLVTDIDGPFIGRVGPVIGYRLGDLNVMRSVSSVPITAKNRAIFRKRRKKLLEETMRVMSALPIVMNFGYMGDLGVKSAWANASKKNLELARAASEGQKIVRPNLSEISLTDGEREFEAEVTMTEDGRVRAEWRTEGENAWAAEGVVVISVYDSAEGKGWSLINRYGRGRAEFAIPTYEGARDLHLYYFASRRGEASRTYHQRAEAEAELPQREEMEKPEKYDIWAERAHGQSLIHGTSDGRRKEIWELYKDVLPERRIGPYVAKKLPKDDPVRNFNCMGQNKISAAFYSDKKVKRHAKQLNAKMNETHELYCLFRRSVELGSPSARRTGSLHGHFYKMNKEWIRKGRDGIYLPAEKIRLTNNDLPLEATVRCERGKIEARWGAVPFRGAVLVMVIYNETAKRAETHVVAMEENASKSYAAATHTYRFGAEEKLYVLYFAASSERATGTVCISVPGEDYIEVRETEFVPSGVRMEELIFALSEEYLPSRVIMERLGNICERTFYEQYLRPGLAEGVVEAKNRRGGPGQGYRLSAGAWEWRIGNG